MSRTDVNRAYEAWKNSTMTCLEDAYKAPSKAKQCAWIWCVEIAKANHGMNLRIIGRNSQKFSAGFVYFKDGQRRFVWITKDHIRQMPVMEDDNDG